MSVVFRKNLPEKLVLGVVNSLNDVLVVSREVEKASTLSGGTQFRQNILAGERHEIIGGVEAEFGTKVPEYPGGIVLEFEIVFCGRNQFVSGTIIVSNVQWASRIRKIGLTCQRRTYA
jgi:hypothetical protein